MATTQDTTAQAIDRQQSVAPPCPCRPCRVKAQRKARKAAYKGKAKETPQLCRDMGDVVRSIRLRVANGDAEDLRAFLEFARLVEDEVVGAVWDARQVDPEGFSWARVGTAYGTTRQGAQRHFQRAFGNRGLT